MGSDPGHWPSVVGKNSSRAICEANMDTNAWLGKIAAEKVSWTDQFFQCSQKKSQTSIFFKLRHTTINWSDEITFKSSSLTNALSPSLPSLALSLALSPFLNLEQRKYQFQVKCAIDLPVQNVELFFVTCKKDWIYFASFETQTKSRCLKPHFSVRSNMLKSFHENKI